MMTVDQWINGELTKKELGYYIEGEDECVLYHHEYEGIKKGVELLCKEYEFESVLELGFGMGWTATEFQEQGIKRHVIIEPNRGIYEAALEWNKNHNAEILNMFSWEYEPKEKFDLVYDDRFYLKNEQHYEHMDKILPIRQWYASNALQDDNRQIADYPIFFKMDGINYVQSLSKYGEYKPCQQ